MRWVIAAVVLAGCAHVRPEQRKHLDDPAMHDVVAPISDLQRSSIYETGEGSTFPSAGSGASAGWISH